MQSSKCCIRTTSIPTVVEILLIGCNDLTIFKYCDAAERALHVHSSTVLTPQIAQLKYFVDPVLIAKESAENFTGISGKDNEVLQDDVIEDFSDLLAKGALIFTLSLPSFGTSIAGLGNLNALKDEHGICFTIVSLPFNDLPKNYADALDICRAATPSSHDLSDMPKCRNLLGRRASYGLLFQGYMSEFDLQRSFGRVVPGPYLSVVRKTKYV